MNEAANPKANMQQPSTHFVDSLMKIPQHIMAIVLRHITFEYPQDSDIDVVNGIDHKLIAMTHGCDDYCSTCSLCAALKWLYAK